jgi:hypothetical protein
MASDGILQKFRLYETRSVRNLLVNFIFLFVLAGSALLNRSLDVSRCET